VDSKKDTLVCGIVLAAGESRRMAGRKLLLPYGETTVAGGSLRALLGSKVDEVIVVLGHDAEKVRQHLSDVSGEARGKGQPGRRLKFALNRRYKEGMFSSVLCGLAAAEDSAKAFVISLADQPGVTSEAVDAVLAAFLEARKGIAVPTYEGRRGHPLVFHRRYRHEVERLDPEEGLRGLLSRHPDDVLEVPVECAGVVRDIDYWSDYAAERP